MLRANPKFRAVTSMSITPDNIDVAEATKRGIIVTVVPAIVEESVADLHIGLMIAVARRMIEGDRSVRAEQFPRLAVEPSRRRLRASARPSVWSAVGRIGQATGAPCAAASA